MELIVWMQAAEARPGRQCKTWFQQHEEAQLGLTSETPTGFKVRQEVRAGVDVWSVGYNIGGKSAMHQY